MTLTPQNKVLKVGSVTKSVWELLASHKYDIDYFQREYRWEEKHVTALLDDLERKFFDSFHEGDSRLQVQKYPHYFLGSIIVSHRDGSDSIIDGQQRLTTLTLLLVHLYHLQNEQHIPPDAGSPVVDLIFSAPYGDKTFNLDILQRKACMEALFAGQPYDASDEPDESIRNLAARYQDIVEHFPDDIKNGRLLHFTDWLKGNVDLVQITVYSDEEAYAIFEAMNDRGLRLNPTEMLKAHLLAKVDDPAKREAANRLWREWIDKLILIDKEDELDFFRAWLRAQYAQKMRDRQPGAVNQDFEEIATRYHEWVRKHESQLGLSKHDDVFSFIDHDFRHFAEYYYRVRKAATTFDADLDVIYFNGWTKFTLQYPLVLAPIRADDDWQMARRKIRLVATYLDIFVARRMVNFRTLRYSSIVYTMFNLMKEIRGLAVTDLVEKLKQNLAQAQETFDGVRSLYMHQQNHSQIHYLLARITSYIEAETACPTGLNFADHVSRSRPDPFQVEHIWANHFNDHRDEFPNEDEFLQYRSRFGGLLLVPASFNRSYGDKPYERKVGPYFGQNLLAKSLSTNCYSNQPKFLQFVRETGLPFQAHDHFRKADLDQRQELYRLLCERIWDPARLDQEAGR